MRKAIKLILSVLYRLITVAVPALGIDLGIHLLNQPSDLDVAGAFLLLAVSVLLLGVALCSALRPLMAQIQEAFRAAGPGCCILLVVAVCLSTTACYRTIPPGHAGIVVQQTGSDRGVQQIPVETGRVFYNPFNENVLDYPTYVQRAIWTASANEGKKQEDGSRPNEEIAFQSSDSLHFTGDVAVAYQLQKDHVPAFYVKFRSDDLDTFTHGFFRDAVRKSIGLAAQQYTQEDINGGKQADLEAKAQATLTEAMKPLGVDIVQLAFTSPPRPPDAVANAIQQKVAAIQRAEQIENEKRQAVAEGAKIIAMANAQAQANASISASINPTLLQWEQIKVLQSKWNGQMPQVTGGGNPLILGLGK